MPTQYPHTCIASTNGLDHVIEICSLLQVFLLLLCNVFLHEVKVSVSYCCGSYCLPLLYLPPCYLIQKKKKKGKIIRLIHHSTLNNYWFKISTSWSLLIALLCVVLIDYCKGHTQFYRILIDKTRALNW